MQATRVLPIPAKGSNTFWPSFVKKRIIFSELTLEEQQRIAAENKYYANIVCRCQKVTEAEVIGAIHMRVGARTLDGVKRRTRTSLGRCQGSFCTQKVIEILARELNMDISEIVKDKKGSYYVK